MSSQEIAPSETFSQLQSDGSISTNKEKKVAPRAIHPSQVLLFSGHMIDAANRSQPRFPQEMEPEAQEKIEEVLDKLQADANNLAIVPGIACGGDILFLEACLQRQMPIEVYLPFEPAEFIAQSVSFAGEGWVQRFEQIKNSPLVQLHLQSQEIGKLPADDNPFERNNLWALQSTLKHSIDKVRLIVLWDGKVGDGKGGTSDMVKQVRHLGGRVEHLDTTKFDFWEI